MVKRVVVRGVEDGGLELMGSLGGVGAGKHWLTGKHRKRGTQFGGLAETEYHCKPLEPAPLLKTDATAGDCC